MKKYRFECGCEFDLKENGALYCNIEDVPQSCPAVWELLEKGLTTGVFQLETSTGRTWSMKLKPTNINHLSALGAILRPGCLNSKMDDGLSLTEHYCMRKNGQEEPVPIHPELEDILRETYQILVYQEQSLEILKKLGGFSLVEADLARRGIGKKDSKIVSEVEELFLRKCKEIGKVSDEDAKKIFGLIKSGERYSFNKSHSVSYAFTTYRSAYQKAHFPQDFFLGKLQHAHYKQDSFEKISDLVNDAKLFNIDVLIPDLFKLQEFFFIDDKNIRYGITDIKGIGEASFEKILQYKDNILSSTSFFDFMFKAGFDIGISTVETLIKSGALSRFKTPRSELLFQLDLMKDLTDTEIREAYRLIEEKNISNLKDLFVNGAKLKSEGGICSFKTKIDIMKSKINVLDNPTQSIEDTPDVIADWENELLGIPITFHPSERTDFGDSNCKQIQLGKKGNVSLCAKIKNLYVHKIKSGPNTGKEMAKVTIEDYSGSALAAVFSDDWESIKNRISKGLTFKMKGFISNKTGLVIKEIVE